MITALNISTPEFSGKMTCLLKAQALELGTHVCSTNTWGNNTLVPLVSSSEKKMKIIAVLTSQSLWDD